MSNIRNTLILIENKNIIKMFFLKMWKRRKLKKKIESLELELGQIKAIISANKKMLTKLYDEYNISKVQMEIESKEIEKRDRQNKIEKLKIKL
jgi:hypothetical protein